MLRNTDIRQKILRKKSEMRVGESFIITTCGKLFGVQIDQQLSFDYLASSLGKKTIGKLTALTRVTPYMSLEKRKLFMNLFFNMQS